MDLTETYRTFSRIWKMFNDVKKAGYTDSAWEACVAEADEIGKDDSFLQEIVCAVVFEAEEESKIGNPDARKIAYKAAADAYNKAWSLLKQLVECEDFSNKGIRLLEQYETAMKNSTFSLKLGKTIYGEICREKSGDGMFVMDIMDFYQAYKDGISDANMEKACRDAELIINARPAYTLHVLDMIESLKQRAKAA